MEHAAFTAPATIPRIPANCTELAINADAEVHPLVMFSGAKPRPSCPA
jgi:hypothetical protein